MIFTAFMTGQSQGEVVWPGHRVKAAFGKGGVTPAEEKREGDGAGPIGAWPLRKVLYRPDQGPAPRTGLAVEAIHREDGWCDAPLDPAYNRPVTLPHKTSAEQMWRDDGLYDLVVVLGHNDDPVIPGAGSAIFLHVATPDCGQTEGCVALARADLEALLAEAKRGDVLEIREG